MAFFKEKRTGSLASQTVVDWGKTIMEGMNSEVLTKHYQRKFDQKIKDLEATPQVFDTTLSFFEPKILERVTALQEEYKKNASIAYNRPDFSNAAVNARQRNAEIIKEISRMQANIQSLQEDENAFAENPGDFYPDVINENLSSEEFLVREAYTELINGDYKNNNAEVVKDVYFTDGGKVMVDIEGLGPVDLKDLRSFDQPTEGLTMGYIEKLANIATTSVEDSAQASALQTELLGDVLNNLNYYEKLELLNAKVTISPEFSGGKIKDTLTPKEDTRYEELFRKLVKDPYKHIAKGNWHAFFNPKVRKEKGMELNAGIEQPDVIQGVEDFIRDFTIDISNQFISAGKNIQKKKKDDELAFEEEKAAARFKQTRLGQEQEALKQYYQAVTNTVLTNFGTNRSVFNEDGTIADVDKYREIWMEELVNQVGDSNKIIATMGYDRALNYFLSNEDIQNALNDKIVQSADMIEAQLGSNVRDGMVGVFDAAYKGSTIDANKLKRLVNAGLLEQKTGETDRGSMPYFQLTDLFLKALTEGNLMKPQLQQQYDDLLKKKFYRNTFKEDFAGLLDFMREVMFNRYTDGTQYENRSNIFTIQKDGSIKGYGGDPTTEAGKILLGESLLGADLLDIRDVSVASGLGDMNPQ